MNEEAIKYGYELFTKDGYNGSIEEYRTLISENKKALTHSYELFRSNGYKDSIEDLSSLLIAPKETTKESPQEVGKQSAVSTGSQLDSAQKLGDSVTQEVPTETTSSNLEYKQDNKEGAAETPLEGGAMPRPVPEPEGDYIANQLPKVDTEKLPEPREDIARLYDRYKQAGVLNIREKENIKETLNKQKKGDRSTWENVKAYADGYLKTGMPIPIFNYDSEKELKEGREQAKKINFLESLPNDKREELNAYAVNRTTSLNKQSENILAENVILEEKGRLLALNTQHVIDAANKLKEQGKPVPQALVEEFNSMKEELQSISSKYNSNFDLIESNQEDIGSFGEELDLFKRNFVGLSYYKDLARLTTADMLSGVMEFGVSTVNMRAGADVMPDSEKFINDFREETARQRELIKPVMSVSDIEHGGDVVNWFTEQLFIQLPVMATLVASGGSAGLGILGASSAGSKMSDLKEENKVNLDKINSKESEIAEMNKAIEDKKRAQEETRGLEGEQVSARIPAEGEMTIEEMESLRDRAIADLDNLKSGRTYGKAEIYLAGLGNGLMGILSEKVSLGILSKGKRVLKTVNKADLKSGVNSFIQNTGKTVYKGGKDSLKEGFSEFGNAIGQNAIDIFGLQKEDTHILDNTVDALASGKAMGFGMSLAPNLMGMGSKAFTNKQQQEALASNSKIIEQMANELVLNGDSMSESAKAILEKRIDKGIKDQESLMTGIFDDVSNRSKEDIGELIKLDKKANKVIRGYQAVASSQMDANVKKSLLEDLKKEAESIREKKQALLDKPLIKKENGTKPETTPPNQGETTTEATTETVAEEGVDTGAEGGTTVQEQDGAEPVVVNDGEGVQPSEPGDTGALEGQPAGDGAVIYTHPATGKVAKTQEDLNEMKAFAEERVAELELTKANKINWGKGKARLLAGNKKVIKDIEALNTETKAEPVTERDAKRWSWKSLDKQPKEKLESKLEIANKQLDKAKTKKEKNDLTEKIGLIEAELGKIEDTDNQAVTTPENRVDEVTPDNVSDIDLSETLGINKVGDFLNNLDDALTKYGKENLSVGIPVAVAQGAVKAMKAAVATAKTGADVISAGINYLKGTDFYKGLTAKEQQEVEANFIQSIQNPSGAQNQGQATQTTNANTQTTPSPRAEFQKMLSGFPLITYIDEKIFTRGFNALEEFVAKKTKQALTAKKGGKSLNLFGARIYGTEVSRAIAQIATNWFNGLPRTMAELNSRRQLSGRQELAYVKGAKITKELQRIINGDPVSARRVHSALDPEIYNEAERVEYDDLKDNEKELFDALRALNEETHEKNYKLGFITEETYEKFKGKYIGRGYETYEELEADNLEKRANVLSNKYMDKIYKERSEMDDWKIENTVRDPIYLTVNRMIRTDRNVAVYEYSNTISKDTKLARPKKDVKTEKDKAGFTLLSGKAYGALDGMYVANYIAEDFQGYFYSNKALQGFYEAFQYIDQMKLKQFFKKFHTVYSPVVQAGNFVSNHAFAAAAGVNVLQLWGNLPQANKDISNKEGDYLLLLEKGILGTDVLTKDLTLQKKRGKNLSLLGRGKKGVETIDKKAQNLYARSDDLMKLSAYKALRNRGFTESEAIQRVFEGFQNYATVGKMWDTASKTPIFGNSYIKFQADLMRILKNSVGKRPLTTATFLGAIKMMAYGTSMYLAGESEEEREIREGRDFIPKIEIPFTDIAIPLTFKISKSKEINLARYLSPYYNYANPNESMIEKVTGFMPYQIRTSDKGSGETANLLVPADVLFGSTVASLFYNEDFRGKTITDPNTTKYTPSGITTEEKLANQINYIMRSQVPLWSLGSDMVSSYTEGEDFYGRDKDFWDVTLSTFIKIQTYDDKSYIKTLESSVKSTEYKAKNIKAKVSAIKKTANDKAAKLKERLDKGLISEDKFKKAINNLQEKANKGIEKQFNEMAKVQSDYNLTMDRANKFIESKEKGGN